jgi:hypothetical protein
MRLFNLIEKITVVDWPWGGENPPQTRLNLGTVYYNKIKNRLRSRGLVAWMKARAVGWALAQRFVCGLI